MTISSSSPLADRHILLGVSGSIAAYKSAELVRLLVTAGATVRVAMTPAATEFVTPLTFQALTGAPVVTDMFAGTGSPDGMDHIAAVRAADVFVIAPATATTLARLAAGSADEPVSALACAATCPVLLAPAMNREMWTKPAVQRNLATLQADGYQLLAPTSGDLACGEHGPGRLSEPAAIAAAVTALLTAAPQVLAGRRVVVSAGATVEAIDAMRVLTNRSSGRLGCALAAAAHAAGAHVHLLAGRMTVTPPPGLGRIDYVEDTAAMAKAAKKACRNADCFISVAAIADYRPQRKIAGKLPRSDGALNLALIATEDIIASIAAMKQAPYCVAFAAEASDLAGAIKAARVKLQRKGVAVVVASPLLSNLGGDDCDLALVAARSSVRLGPQSKIAAAAKIIARIADRLPR